MTIGLFPEQSSAGAFIAGLLLPLCLSYSNAASAAAPPQPEIRPKSELKVTATIPIGKQADWVKVTPTTVWIGGKGPYAVTGIDPQTNQATRIELPGDPCAGLAADAENLWVPLCGKTPKLARVDLKKRELTGVFNVGPGAAEGGIAVGAGIAMASLLGRHALYLVVGEEPDLALMRRKEPQPIPFYFLREPAVRVVAGWYQLLDRLGR